MRTTLLCGCQPLATSLEETNPSQNSVVHSFNTSKRRRCVCPVINKWSLDSNPPLLGYSSHGEGHGKLSSFVAGVMLNLVSRGCQRDHGSRNGFCCFAAGVSLSSCSYSAWLRETRDGWGEMRWHSLQHFSEWICHPLGCSHTLPSNAWISVWEGRFL